MLQILLLGPPTILHDGKPLTVQRRQLRTLLFFLACQPEGVGRGELLTYFWPNSKDTDARRLLREILSKLRNQLPSQDDLQTKHDRIWLNPATVHTDIQTFFETIQPAKSILDSPAKKISLSDDLVVLLENALSIWRSPNFLAGARISNTHEFDNWQQEKASSLEYYRWQCLEHLINHFSDTGVTERAIYYVHKALETDPLNNVMQAQLVSLLYNAGRVSEAQSYYAQLKDLYKHEMGSEPPVLINFGLDEIGSTLIDDKNKHSSKAKPIKIGVPLFVGREKELERLEYEYHNGIITLITGEIGSGKTRFVQHFLNSLHDRLRVLTITCREDEAHLPFQPLIQIIRNHVSHEELDRLDAKWLKSLSFLVPDLIRKKSLSQSDSDISSQEGRQEVFKAIRQLFVSISQSKRLILFLDDVQWCDLDTMEALMFLVRESFFKDHGFLLFTSRTEIENPRIRFLLFSEKQHINIPRIDLGPLSRRDVDGLVEQLVSRKPSDGFLSKLYRATGGNPLFIQQTLEAILASTDDLHELENKEIPLAQNLSDVFLEKENNLSSQSREVLFMAAVYGMEFQYDVLDQIHLYEPNVLVQCLEELEEKKFIHPVRNNGIPGLYSFNHSLIRTSLLSRLSLARQCQLHDQIADALSVSKGSLNNRQASVIARHYEAAGKPASAFRFWVKAGQYARTLFSIHEAYNAFGQANNIRIDFGQTIPNESLYELFLNWGDLTYNIMDIKSLDECYTAMYETGEQINNPLLLGAGLSGMSLPAIFSLEIEKAIAMLEQSIQILDGTDNLYERILARSRMGIAFSTGMQNEKAIELYTEAIELGDAQSNQMIRQVVTTVRYQLAVLYCLMGWPEKAEATGKHGIRNAYLLINRPTIQSNVHLCLAMAAYYLGNFPVAENEIKLCLKSTETLHNPRTSALAQILQARIYYHTGQFDKTWGLATSALTLSEEKGYIENASEAHCVRGDVYLGIKDYGSAILEYSRGSELFPGTFPGLNSYYRLGYALYKNGETDRGMKVLDEAIAAATRAEFAAIYLPARYLRAKLIRENGNLAESQRLEDEILQAANDRKLSLDIFPETPHQARSIFESTNNDQAEIIFTNLLQYHGFTPGNWINILIYSLLNTKYDDKQFDRQRLCRFLEGYLFKSS